MDNVDFVMSTEAAITRNRFSDNALGYDDEFLRHLSPRSAITSSRLALSDNSSRRYTIDMDASGLDQT